MHISIGKHFIQALEFAIVSLFGVFVLGAYLLALFKYQLPERRVVQLRRLGWLIVGIAFLLVGFGMLLMIFHQFSGGVATRMSRGNYSVSVSFSSSPFMFLFTVAFEVFFAGLFFFMGVGYLKLFWSMREK